MTLQLGFHGAAGTVTGSRHLLISGETSVLVDAGLFQGLKELRELNCFVTHGEPPAAAALARRIEKELGCRTFEPRLGSVFDLDAILGG
jgi:Cft2 family RNA processing exonuclease